MPVMIQIEGFKKALSRGGGASRFLRFLSRKKDDGAAASADTITLDDMLTFSPVRRLPILAYSAHTRMHAAACQDQ